eukprot:m.146229 g.146229  ORF g.146229 m.146229 type:complete len:396 (-) comp14150_c2_seq1:488-1675(-)
MGCCCSSRRVTQQDKASDDESQEQVTLDSLDATTEISKDKAKGKGKGKEKRKSRSKGEGPAQGRRKGKSGAAGGTDEQPVKRRGMRSYDSTVSVASVQNSGEWVELTKEECDRVEDMLNRVHHFSRHELRRCFAAFKENGGTLSRGLFEIVFSTYSHVLDERVAGNVFDMFDKNHDGSFTFEEFVMFLSTMVKGTMEERAEFFFQLLDSEKTGKVTKQAVTELFEKIPIDYFHRIVPSNRSTRIDFDLVPLEELAETEAAEQEMQAEQERQFQVAQKEQEAFLRKRESKRIQSELLATYRRSLHLDDDADVSAGAEACHEDGQGAMAHTTTIDEDMQERAHRFFSSAPSSTASVHVKPAQIDLFKHLADTDTITLEEFTSAIVLAETTLQDVHNP